MTNKQEKTLSDRISDLEDKIDYLIYAGNSQKEPELSEGEFKTFYSRVETEFKDIGVMGGLITMNTRFSDILKHRVLYPDYDTGLWYPIGKSAKDIPIDFRNMKYDFVIEMLEAGNFHPVEGISKGGN